MIKFLLDICIVAKRVLRDEKVEVSKRQLVLRAIVHLLVIQIVANLFQNNVIHVTQIIVLTKINIGKKTHCIKTSKAKIFDLLLLTLIIDKLTSNTISVKTRKCDVEVRMYKTK